MSLDNANTNTFVYSEHNLTIRCIAISVQLCNVFSSTLDRLRIP